MSTETAPRRPAAPQAAAPLVEAEELEIILPSGDGVGPWTGTLHAGEQVLLLGPSGSGKSTLLLALAGAVPSHVRATVRGSLRVADRDPVTGGVTALSDVVGLLGQDPVSGVCLPGVADEVALPLENRCVPPERIGQQVTAALRAVSAQHLGGREASTLSGGQLQRISLAAATVAGPSLLLLDEPTSMLDAEGAAAVRASIEAAAARPGVACVLVEHRLDGWAGSRGSAGLPARTIALDRSGRVLADGPTAEVLAAHGEALAEAGCWLPGESAPSPAPPAAGPPLPPTRDAEVLLRTCDLSVGHADVAVLQHVDLELAAGEVLAIVGANGAGKSTLLGALARLDAPLAGDVIGAAAGLVFQRPESQFVASSVHAELAASCADPQRVERMIARLGLADWAEASPYRLSGGQQRRLSIGAMLLQDRPVLLADEPALGLDHAAHRTVTAMLRQAADEGRAVALTTHDLRMVESADRVAVVADGTVLAVRTPAELLADRELLRRAGLLAGAPSLGEAAPSAAPAPAPASSPEPASSASIAAAAVAGSAHRTGRGWLSQANPAVLLGVLTALSVLTLVLTDPVPLLGLYLVLAAAVMATTRIGPLRLLRAQVPFAVFALGVLCVNALSRPGREPWPELPVRVTEEGMLLGAALALRALVIGLGALAVARAADPRRTLVSLQQIGLPARFALALLAGRRLLDELPDRWRTLTRAHRMRLPLREDGAVPPLGPRHLLGCAFALLVDAIRSAERIALALESRGLREGPRTVWRPVGIGWPDALVVLVPAVVATAVLLYL